MYLTRFLFLVGILVRSGGDLGGLKLYVVRTMYDDWKYGLPLTMVEANRRAGTLLA